jgi:hypothetical protein
MKSFDSSGHEPELRATKAGTRVLPRKALIKDQIVIPANAGIQRNPEKSRPSTSAFVGVTAYSSFP